MSVETFNWSRLCMERGLNGQYVRKSDYDTLAAENEALKEECADLISGKEYQAMQHTLGDVNGRLAEAHRLLERCISSLERDGRPHLVELVRAALKEEPDPPLEWTSEPT